MALTCREAALVRSAVPAANTAVLMPTAPPIALALPAAVLAAHPAVVAAEREVAATWEPIAAARAERLPRFDLAAAISGQWLRAGGSTLDITTWALTPTLRRRSSTEVPAPRTSKARRRGFGLR